MLALRGRALIASSVATVEDRVFRLAQVVTLSEAAAADWALTTRIDPGNTIAWNNWMVSTHFAIGAAWKQGRVREALEGLRRARPTLQPHVGRSAMLAEEMLDNSHFRAWLLAELGDVAQTEEALRESDEYRPLSRAGLAPGSFELERRNCTRLERSAFASRVLLDWPATQQRSRVALECLDRLAPADEGGRQGSIELRREALQNLALAALAAHRDAEASDTCAPRSRRRARCRRRR
jgi:hypothetical protein